MNSWLPSLITNTPEDGYHLAITLARKAVGITQPDENIRKLLRPTYANNANSLIFVCQVVAINFQTIAAANTYWKDYYY